MFNDMTREEMVAIPHHDGEMIEVLQHGLILPGRPGGAGADSQCRGLPLIERCIHRYDFVRERRTDTSPAESAPFFWETWSVTSKLR
jgi:hypothetical protein